LISQTLRIEFLTAFHSYFLAAGTDTSTAGKPSGFGSFLGDRGDDKSLAWLQLYRSLLGKSFQAPSSALGTSGILGLTP
jgi:hypothetical protein